MRNITLLFIISIFFTFSFKSDKKEYPKEYFRSPVNFPIRLSGTFGELRPGHFHSGIDIKSPDGKGGHNLFAAANGYVARIKVKSGGYGRAIYIKHPNGYTSVYAHLNSFTKELEDYIIKNQYRKKSFEVDLYPEKEKFSFQKGEKIGKMGNSGGSFGPHLHFEIRDSSQRPINPLLFGIQMEDTKPPKIHQLKVYYLDENRNTLNEKVFDVYKSGHGYKIKGDTISLGAFQVGFALKVYDHHNKVSNWNGIYSLTMYNNDAPAYSFEMEKFSFNETRYLNAHLDYKEQVTKKAYFNRCYSLPGNKLSIYGKKVDNGVIHLYKSKTQKIKFVAKDINGNSTFLEFWVKRGNADSQGNSKIYNYYLPYNQENKIKTGSIDVNFPKGCFYEDVFLEYDMTVDKSDGYFSPVYQLGDKTIPVHKYFSLAISSENIPQDMKKKAFIAYCDADGDFVNCGGKWENGKLKTKVRKMGNYSIRIDTQAPKIRPISFKYDMKGKRKMTFKAKENLPAGGKVKELYYKATVDGKWILMEYDAKNDLLIHRFDWRIKPGKHLLKLTVWDSNGNRNVFEREFIR